MEQEFQIKEVEDVRSFHVKSFLSMMDDKERKARYINDLLKVFKTFFNYLKKEGHIKERPTANVKNMKQPKVKIITFTESEIRKLLNHFSGRTFLSICVKQDGVTHLLLISQIKYLEVEGHYVAYHTSNGIYSEYTTLKKAEKRINRTWFAQCNQSYLLNMKYINSLSRDSVVVDGKEIFISRKMRHSFLAAVAEFLGGKNQ